MAIMMMMMKISVNYGDDFSRWILIGCCNYTLYSVYVYSNKQYQSNLNAVLFFF